MASISDRMQHDMLFGFSSRLVCFSCMTSFVDIWQFISYDLLMQKKIIGGDYVCEVTFLPL